MHREEIIAALKMKGFRSLRSFERERGLADRSVRDVLRDRASKPTEAAIAAELQKPLHVLFPRRYEAPEGALESPNGDVYSEGTAAPHRLSATVR